MFRTSSFKIISLSALTISVLASAAAARQLECSYEYGTHKEVRMISEIHDTSGELEYTFRHEYGKHGKKTWFGDDEPSLTETKGPQNFIKVSPNLYHWGLSIFKRIIYVDFENPKFYEIISFGPTLRALEITSRKIDGNNRMLELPVTVWDCKRLD